MSFKSRFTIGLLLWTALCAIGVAHAEPPPCAPMVKGTLGPYPVRAVYGTLGRHFYWWCQGSDKYYGLSCSHKSGCSEVLFGSFLATKQVSLDTAWAKNVTFECDQQNLSPDNANLCAERSITYEAHKADWLAAKIVEVWKVKPNAPATTRPAYTLINGVLGTKEAARATVGTVCDLTKPTAPAPLGDIRAEYGTPGIVTICTKEK